MEKIEIQFIKLPRIPKKVYLVLGLILLIAAVFFSGYFSGRYFEKRANLVILNSDIYTQFTAEIYDKIQENYWDNISDKDLSNLFKLGVEKLSGVPQILKSENKEGIQKLISKIIKNKDDQKKKEFVTQLGDIVLTNLKPFGISRLYTEKEEQTLTNAVNNIDTGTNLYEILGVNKNASQVEIEETYKEKTSELSKEKTPEAEQKLAQINRAYEALSAPEKRKIYDELGIEPAVIFKSIKPDILYVQIKRASPAIIDEFSKTINSFENNENLNSLILDLRSNIGGSVDILPSFLGFFIGQNQYAFDFFRQGESIPFKTTSPKLASLSKFKKIVILVNGETQSSAEIITSTLKKYNVGVVIGTHTKGWGTIKRVFNIDHQIDPNEKYSIFLVHSLTLREDGQPIEGKGIEPMVNIKNPTWEKQLFAYFNYDELIQAVKEVLKEN